MCVKHSQWSVADGCTAGVWDNSCSPSFTNNAVLSVNNAVPEVVVGDSATVRNGVEFECKHIMYFGAVVAWTNSG